ncbi:VOC family protein [Microtetraspora niveoalba]|uniref:VOC family protein n=1 Tax=Microtetraspora niveoalba TaxID=46175 RepID=UPI000829A350|nr:VOC family protein [Microtetraspora niveoalba]
MEVLSSRVLIRPRDPEASRRFYRETLGLAVYREFGPPQAPGVVFFLGQGLLEVSGHDEGRVETHAEPRAEPRAETRVGSHDESGDEGRGAGHGERRAEGHGGGGNGSGGLRPGPRIWLQVRDVHAEHRRLRDAGVPVLRPPRTEPWGLVEMWIEDPDGLPIVLVEVPADHPLRRDTR